MDTVFRSVAIWPFIARPRLRHFMMNSRWKAGVGVKHAALATPLGLAKENGGRTDVGAQITYCLDEDKPLNVCGQVTAANSG
jgi:hypothetical protein